MNYPKDFINRIILGDSIDIMKEIPNKSIDLIFTDPPYNVLSNGKLNDRFKWDDIDLVPFTKQWFNLSFSKLKDNSFEYIFWSQKYLKEGFNIFNPDRLLLWNYENLIIGGNGNFSYDYEPIFVIKKGNPKLIKGRHLSIYKYTKPQSNFKYDKLLHPTQKPLKLIKKLIEISSKENDIILDPFLGSGTTAVACKELGRDL